MRSLAARFRAMQERARTRERQYGWLFPAIVPLCLGAMMFASLIIPVIAHWDAVDEIDKAGGRIVMSSAYLPVLNIRMPVFSAARRVELAGPDVSDDLLVAAGNLRGLDHLVLSATSITEQAIVRFRQNHPHVTVFQPDLYKPIYNPPDE
jgi:hypothetical protein